jgi:hypothetical protein
VWALAAACQGIEPINRIEECLAPSIDSIRTSRKTSEASCDFGRPTTLLAIPAAQPTEEALIKLGLPEDAAQTVLDVDTKGNRWCTVDRFNPREGTTKPGWRVQCTAAGVQIETLSAVTAGSMVFTLASLPDGNVRLQKLRDAD